MRKIGFGFGAMCLLVGCGGGVGEGRTPSAPSVAAEAPAPAQEGYGPAGYPQASAAAPMPGMPAADAKAESSGPPSRTAPPSLRPPPAPPAARPTEAPVAIAPREPQQVPASGQLTAGVWDDNRNFDFWKPYAAKFREQNGADFAMFADQEMTTARDVAGKSGVAHPDLDVQLVLDTTGSMGDELSYLQGEFETIAAKVHARFPNVTPRWSLVVYRDHGDEYIARQFGFTTDTVRFRKDLRTQSAAGGGDIPEAVVEGLGAGMKQAWRKEPSVAKVVFWVADAPAHPGEGKLLAGVLRDAKAKGIHIYPVAASDTDPAAEYQMRSAAQLTGGRYIFLTNDSGIGNDHAEPHIPCYNVTRLDNAIVRMLQVELSGQHVEPEGNEIVRAVGKPNKEGKCTLSSGALVASF